MTATYNEPALSFDELTLHLIASGVIKLYEKVKDGAAPTLPYPKELQRGLDRLVLSCLRQAENPPQGVPDLLAWCQKPLSNWPIKLSEDADTANKLLDDQIPTGICDEWAIASGDVEAEAIQKQLLLNVMQVCKSDDAPDAYVAFRRLLISQPVLTEFELLQHCLNDSLQILEAQIKTAYELVPESCAVNGQLHCCSNCGNIMLRTVKGDLICAEDRCRTQGFKVGRQVSQKEGVLWLKRGPRRFVAAPGRAELRLADKLEELELEVKLWPNFDSYDLRIVFPDGDAWAIDVKDWKDPFLLARKVKQQEPPIPSDPPWTQAYFVFPDDRKQQRSDYKRAFCNHTRLPKQIKAKFEKELIKDVKRKLEDPSSRS
ncbi:MAG: hypothetical protein EBE86_001645 [Hormoscilla sp. GUM202]|nr:hypothetical protein [Hormoscilla sp. GUM202]